MAAPAAWRRVTNGPYTLGVVVQGASTAEVIGSVPPAHAIGEAVHGLPPPMRMRP